MVAMAAAAGLVSAPATAGHIREGAVSCPLVRPVRCCFRGMSLSFFETPVLRVLHPQLPVLTPAHCRQSVLPVSATLSGSGPLSSKSSLSMIKEARIEAEPPQDQKIKLRVDFAGKDTQRAYDTVVRGLSKNTPPTKGFRTAKGGKSAIVPTGILINMLGQGRVRKFVIEEIVRTTLVEYVEKEGIKAKKNLTTEQSAEELDKVFEPGKEFGFNATLELEEEIPAESETKSEAVDTEGVLAT